MNEDEKYEDNKNFVKFLYKNKGINQDRIISEEKDEDLEIKISKNICFICKDLPLLTKTCGNCETKFCVICLENKSNSDLKKICINCNTNLQEEDKEEINKIPSAENDYNLQKIELKCFFHHKGCQELLKYNTNEILEHEKICKFYLICKGCSKGFSINEMDLYENHQFECEGISIKCPECNFSQSQKSFKENLPLVKHLTHVIKAELKIEMENYMKNLLKNQKFTFEKFEKFMDFYKDIDKPLNIEYKKTLAKNADNTFDLSDRFCFITLFKNMPNFNLINTYENSANLTGGSFANNNFQENEEILNSKSKQNYRIDFLNEENSLQYNPDYLIYGTEEYDLEIFDLKKNKFYKKIKNAHSSNIICVRNNIIESLKKNIILSTSFDRSVKLWDGDSEFKILLELEDVFNDYSLFSGTILDGKFVSKSKKNFEDISQSNIFNNSEGFSEGNLSKSFLNLDENLDKKKPKNQQNQDNNFSGKLFIFLLCQNTNQIKLYEYEEKNNNNTCIQTLICQKPRYIDYFIYFNTEYEQTETFLLISDSSGIQSFIFNGESLSSYKNYSEAENVQHSYFKIFKNKKDKQINQNSEINLDMDYNQNNLSESYLIIDSDFSGILRIWDFFSGDLIRKINMDLFGLKSISNFVFINEKFCVISGNSENIFLIDIEEKDNLLLKKTIKRNYDLNNKPMTKNQIFSLKFVNDFHLGKSIFTYEYNKEINLLNYSD